jgi:glycerol-3-phosphate acyltransferase PlsY
MVIYIGQEGCSEVGGALLELLVNLLAYLAIPFLCILIAVWKRIMAAMVGGIISLAVVSPFLADDFGNWIFAPIVVLIIMLALMIVHDAWTKEVGV